MTERTNLDKDFFLLFTIWFLASIASLGSLFFSEIMGFIPCELCWYQRIFIYPVAISLTVALFKVDRSILFYLYPLVILGLLTALFHNFLMWGLIEEQYSPCVSGVPCSARYIEWAGFITIPLLSLFAFILLFILFSFSLKERNQDEQ